MKLNSRNYDFEVVSRSIRCIRHCYRKSKGRKFTQRLPVELMLECRVRRYCKGAGSLKRLRICEMDSSGGPLSPAGLTAAKVAEAALPSADTPGHDEYRDTTVSPDPKSSFVANPAPHSASSSVSFPSTAFASAVGHVVAPPMPPPTYADGIIATWDDISPPETLEHICRLRGLPWHVTRADILDFFGDTRFCRNGIIMLYDSRGTGMVAFASASDKSRALTKHRQSMGTVTSRSSRYIEVESSTGEEFERARNGE